MRWLFLLLLAANLLFFSWNWLRNGNEQVSRDVDAASREKGLVMLSELPRSTEEPEPAPQAEPALPPSPPSLPDEGTKSAATKPPLPQPAEETSFNPEATPQPRKTCYVLGPFNSSGAVQDILKRITNSPAILERRWSSPQQRLGYWVHIPPAASSKEARDIVQVLNRAGISDVQLINSGEMRNAISLGIFSSMENARKRRNEVARQGFDVAINEVKIRKRRYWVALRGSGGRPLSGNLLERLIEDTTEAGIEKRPCDNLFQ